MRRVFASSAIVLVTALGLLVPPLAAQAPCPGVTIVVNTPEDQMLLAYNGADKPEDQIAALDKFAQENADSKFMPCANEYYTATYVKLGQFDKAIQYGEKDWAANYHSLNLMINLMKAYVGAGNASDTAFDVIAKAPEVMKTESNIARPEKATDDEWKKIQQDETDTIKDDRAYMEYAFFQLLPRVTDAQKRIHDLDAFVKAYPDTPNMAQVNFAYFRAYELAKDSVKADEYGEKAIAGDPNNVEVLNAVAYDYAVARRTNLDKAAEYASKAAQIIPSLKKSEGVSDQDFSNFKNTQLGMAHFIMGYTALVKAGNTHKVAPALEHLKTAEGLLAANPELLGETLYFLGYAYEAQYPPNHHLAAEALTKATAVQSSMQGQSRELLAKVKAAR